MKKNYDNLKTIFFYGLKEDENPTIDFAIETRMHDVGAQFDYLEPELLRLSGNLDFGIEISQYQPASDEE